MTREDLTASALCGTNGSASLPFDRAAVEGPEMEPRESLESEHMRHALGRAIGWVEVPTPRPVWWGDVKARYLAMRVAASPPRLGME